MPLNLGRLMTRLVGGLRPPTVRVSASTISDRLNALKVSATGLEADAVEYSAGVRAAISAMVAEEVTVAKLLTEIRHVARQ